MKFSLDDLIEWFQVPDILPRIQAVLQPLDELLVGLHRLPVLQCGHPWGELHDLFALRGLMLAVPFKGVTTREKVATQDAEVDHERVHLCGIAMTFEVVKVLELFVLADTALDRLDGAMCKVGLRCLEKHSIPWPESAGDLVRLVCIP